MALVAVGIAVGVDGAPAGAFCPSPPNGCGSGPPPAPPPAPDVPPAPFPQPNPGGPWIPPPDPAHPGNGGGGQAPANSKEVADAATLAEAALQVEGCNKVVSGGQPAGNTAKDRWKDNRIAEHQGRAYVGPRGLDPDVAATVPGTDNGQGYGKIDVWYLFYSDQLTSSFLRRAKRENEALYDIVKDWTPTQLRALVLLHEAAHLSGALASNHEGDWKPNNQSGFEFKIAKACTF